MVTEPVVVVGTLQPQGSVIQVVVVALRSPDPTAFEPDRRELQVYTGKARSRTAAAWSA
jgi:hypothetical protein